MGQKRHVPYVGKFGLESLLLFQASNVEKHLMPKLLFKLITSRPICGSVFLGTRRDIGLLASAGFSKAIRIHDKDKRQPYGEYKNGCCDHEHTPCNAPQATAGECLAAQRGSKNVRPDENVRVRSSAEIKAVPMHQCQCEQFIYI